MKRMECAVRPLRAKKLQRFILRRSRESKERQIAVLAMHQHFLQKLVLSVQLRRLFALYLRIFLQSVVSIRQGRF